MNIESSINGSLNIVTVHEARIDAAAAIEFKDAMREHTDGGPDHIVLDLSNVAFVDSSGLGAIVAAKKLIGADRQLDLAGLTGDVAKVFELTRMASVFEIHRSVADLDLKLAG